MKKKEKGGRKERGNQPGRVNVTQTKDRGRPEGTDRRPNLWRRNNVCRPEWKPGGGNDPAKKLGRANRDCGIMSRGENKTSAKRKRNVFFKKKRQKEGDPEEVLSTAVRGRSSAKKGRVGKVPRKKRGGGGGPR